MLGSQVDGSTVLVTGANRGIGRALVEEALRRGAKRVYAGTRHPLVHPDPRVTTLTMDVTDPAQISAAVARVDVLDILVNNAGFATCDDLGDPQLLDRHLAVNLFGPLAVTEAFTPLLARTRGAVVNVLSLAALASVPVLPAYSISKAAAFALSQSQRALLASRGVRVHAVLAGPVDTDMTRDLAVPKAPADAVARAVFDGVRDGDEEIFPDPMSLALAGAWRTGPVKALERQHAELVADDFTTSFTVDRTPDQVFAAINDVRAWWAGDIEGPTDQLGAEFTYRHGDAHVSRQRVVELVSGKRVAWHVVDSRLSFLRDDSEWTGTEILFDIAERGAGTEVRFTHVGLVPRRECFHDCSGGWTYFVNGSLRELLATT